MAKIIYVRHGQGSLFTDNYDNLSPLGWKQSELLGTYFKKQGIEISKIFIGPLQRHRQTVEGIQKGFQSNFENIQTLQELIEHDGPKVKRYVLPELIKTNEEIKALSLLPEENFEQSVQKHVAIYNEVTALWAEEKLTQDLSQFSSWKDFRLAASGIFDHIKAETNKGETNLVVTSGGPVSVAVGKILGLSDSKSIQLSHNIYNSSVSEFLVSKRQCSLLSYNVVSHLGLDEEMWTVI